MSASISISTITPFLKKNKQINKQKHQGLCLQRSKQQTHKLSQWFLKRHNSASVICCKQLLAKPGANMFARNTAKNYAHIYM